MIECYFIIQVFRQHLEFLHLQTEQFVESTGTFPMHGAVRTSSDESERRPLLPLVEMDQVELQLADLLSADGGLQSELASKAFLKRIQAVSLDCHKMLCITILKQTKTQPALSAFTQGDGFRVLGPWLKVFEIDCLSSVFYSHVQWTHPNTVWR